MVNLPWRLSRLFAISLERRKWWCCAGIVDWDWLSLATQSSAARRSEEMAINWNQNSPTWLKFSELSGEYYRIIVNYIRYITLSSAQLTTSDRRKTTNVSKSNQNQPNLNILYTGLMSWYCVTGIRMENLSAVSDFIQKALFLMTLM